MSESQRSRKDELRKAEKELSEIDTQTQRENFSSCRDRSKSGTLLFWSFFELEIPRC